MNISRSILFTRIFPLFAFTVLAFALQGQAHADADKGQHGMMGDGKADMPMMGHDKPDAMHKGMPGDMMTADLDLNEQQKAALKNAMEKRRAAMEGERDFHEQLREMAHNDKFDERKMHDMISKHNKQTEDKIVAAAKAMHEFRASLSAEQKTKLDEKRKQMKSRMGDRMRDHMKGDEGCGPDTEEGADE